MLNIGIVGCGKIAQVRHIPECAANERVRLAGYFTPNTRRAEEMAARYGGKVYASAKDLFDDPEIDAVSICAANYAHARLSIQALHAGKHVLCEKPMAVTPAECEAMTAEAAKSGRRLLIAQNQRLDRVHVKAKELLEEGVIGRIISFRSILGHGGPETWSITPGKDTWFFDKARAVIGVMADLGIHKTDLLRYLLGQDVLRTTARMVTLDKTGPDGSFIGLDDNAVCIYEMTGGAFGTMTASWTCYGPMDNSTVLYGGKGVMHIYDDPAHSIVIKFSDGTEKFYDVEENPTDGGQAASGVIDEFVSAIEEERASLLDAEDILKSMKAVFASIRSMETGGTILVE